MYRRQYAIKANNQTKCWIKKCPARKLILRKVTPSFNPNKPEKLSSINPDISVHFNPTFASFPFLCGL